jgi:hypothetical protein
MGDSWNTRTLSFADLNPTRRFKDFKDKNTSCIGMAKQPMDIAEKVMKDVTLETLYQTAYEKQPHFIKLPDFSETERASGINPHPAASWRAKFEFMLVMWEKKNADEGPCGIPPHAGVSWRSKYEFMDKLWLQQKVDHATMSSRWEEGRRVLCAEIVKKDAAIALLEEERRLLRAEIAKKTPVIAVIDEDPTCSAK